MEGTLGHVVLMNSDLVPLYHINLAISANKTVTTVQEIAIDLQFFFFRFRASVSLALLRELARLAVAH